jgi:hypothetical protein
MLCWLAIYINSWARSVPYAAGIPEVLKGALAASFLLEFWEEVEGARKWHKRFR